MFLYKYYLTVSILTLLGLSNLSAFERHDIIKTVEKITEVHHLLTKETAEWNSERESLELDLSLLKSAIKDFKGGQDKLLQKVNELKKKKNELEALVAGQEKLLKNITNFIDKNGRFLKSSCKSIPGSLQFLIEEQLIHLENSLKSESIDIHEKLNAVRALTTAILKVQKEVHRTREIISINSDTLEVDALYLGTFTGFFRSPVNNSVGKILFQNGQWKAVEDKSLKENINALFDQFDKKDAPKIIQLPIGGQTK